MTVAPFSHFSAVSELFVTAAVFYFFWKAVKEDDHRWAFITVVIAFETLVNITYMARRLVESEPKGTAAGWTVALAAVHGALSLLMFLGLVAFVLLSFRAARVEHRNYFREHPLTTATFLVLWTLSVLTGEALYLLQLAGAVTL